MPVLDVFGFPTFFLSKIGNITVDAVLSETHRFASSITENPVENGSIYSDNVVLLPVVLEMECRISDATASFARFNYPGRSNESYKDLVRLQTKREVFSVITGINIYQNMLFEELSIPRAAADGQSIRFSAVLKEILVVGDDAATNRDLLATDIQHTALPPGSNGEVSKVPFL